MKTAKQEAQELLDRLPDDVSMERVLYELHVKASILRGLDDIARGDFIDDAELGERLKRWRESSGQRKLSQR